MQQTVGPDVKSTVGRSLVDFRDRNRLTHSILLHTGTLIDTSSLSLKDSNKLVKDQVKLRCFAGKRRRKSAGCASRRSTGRSRPVRISNRKTNFFLLISSCFLKCFYVLFAP